MKKYLINIRGKEIEIYQDLDGRFIKPLFLVEMEKTGTALKPAFEPIILCRKPCSENSVAKNIQKWGVGAININATKIPLVEGEKIGMNRLEKWSGFGQMERPEYRPSLNEEGRWPANVLIDEEVEDDLGKLSRYYYCTKASKKEKQVEIDGEVKEYHLKNNLDASIVEEINRYLCNE